MKQSLLIVEDDDATRNFLVENLAAEGFAVAAATGAAEGVRQIEVSGMSKDRVSGLCRGLDERVEAFRNRPLEGDYPIAHWRNPENLVALHLLADADLLRGRVDFPHAFFDGSQARMGRVASNTGPSSRVVKR